MNQFNISFHEEKRWYEENYECPEEFAHLDEWAPLVKTEDLEECEYKNMRGTFDSYQKLKEEKETAENWVSDLKTELEEFEEYKADQECGNKLAIKICDNLKEEKYSLYAKWQERGEEIEKLKEEVAEIPDLLEAEKYKEREQNEQDWVDKEEEEREELEEEIEKLKKENKEYEAESLNSQIKEKRLYEEGFGLQKQVSELTKKLNRSEEESEEEEKCEECNKVLEGEDKCGKGCPAYDKGWEETHEED